MLEPLLAGEGRRLKEECDMRARQRILVILDHQSIGYHYLAGIHNYFSDDRWELHLELPINLKMIARINVALREWKPHGILAKLFSDRMERLIRNSGIPAVNLDLRKSALPTVWTDEVATGRMVARYFMDSGFRKFAFFSRIGKIWAAATL